MYTGAGLKSSAINSVASWRPISDEVIKEGLQIVLNKDTHPVLICCTSGILETSILVGCLRKLQGWNYNSIVVEYRIWAGNKSKYAVEQYIELFDVDLVNV
jgi:protein tyrosine/serine phosphatase